MAFGGLCNGSIIAVFGVLDTVALAAGSGYDDILTEPNLVSSGADDRTGTIGREETEYKIRCQVEERSSDRLRQLATGQQRLAQIEIVAVYRELVTASLIDADGRPLIRLNARLKQLEDRSGNVIQVYPNPPGMYVDEIILDPLTGASYDYCTWLLSPRNEGV